MRFTRPTFPDDSLVGRSLEKLFDRFAAGRRHEAPVFEAYITLAVIDGGGVFVERSGCGHVDGVVEFARFFIERNAALGLRETFFLLFQPGDFVDGIVPGGILFHYIFTTGARGEHQQTGT